MKQNKALLPAVVFLALGVTGCASTPDNGLSDVEIRTQRLSAIAGIEERRDIIKPQLADKELAWFATDQVNAAKAAWRQSEEQYQIVSQSADRMNERLRMFNSTTRGEAIDSALTEAIEALNNANVIRAEAQVVLSEAFANRSVLNDLDAQNRYKRSYADVDAMLKGLVDVLAQGRKDDAVKGLPGLLRTQRELEVRVVTAIHLSGHGEMLLELEKESLNTIAPQTFASAESAYEQAYLFIVEDSRNTARITELADQAGFRIRHALQIGKDVRFLQAHETTDYEHYLLNFEKYLNGISIALNMGDLRDRSIAEQAKLINEHIRLQQESEEPEMVALKEELSELQEKLEALALQLEEKGQLLVTAQVKETELSVLIAALQTEREEALVAELPETNDESDDVAEGYSEQENADDVEPEETVESDAVTSEEVEQVVVEDVEQTVVEEAVSVETSEDNDPSV